jgi:hypothetical protein
MNKSMAINAALNVYEDYDRYLFIECWDLCWES